MKRVPFLGFGVALLAMSLAAPAAAASPILEVSQQKGSSAWADTGSCTRDLPDTGDETCEFSGASLFDGRSRYNGVQSKGPQLCVNSGTFVYDASENTYTDTFSSGCSQAASVSIARDLLSASGVGSVATETATCTYDEDTDIGSCTDPEPGPTFDVDVQWTGTPPVNKSTYRERNVNGGCSNSYYSKGSNVDATASGTIDDVDVTFNYAQMNSGISRFTFACR